MAFRRLRPATTRKCRPPGRRAKGSLVVASAIGSLLLVGCAPSGAESIQFGPAAVRQSQDDGLSEAIRRDPVAYLREVLRHTEQIPRYRMTFYRQERTGLSGSMAPMEKIRVRFRAEPFSVKFEWDDPDAYLYESIYVAGTNDNKLILRERKGWLLFPPQIRRVEVLDPVRWGQSRRPITDFGITRMMQRTLAAIDHPPGGGPVEVRYSGREVLDPLSIEAHHFVILRRATPAAPHPRQDLWIDARTNLPAGSRLSLPDGRVDALYLYADIQPDPSISDADFQVGGPPGTPGKTGKP